MNLHAISVEEDANSLTLQAVIAMYDGVTHILHPKHDQGSRWWSYGVLGVSIVFELMSFKVAWGEC